MSVPTINENGLLPAPILTLNGADQVPVPAPDLLPMRRVVLIILVLLAVSGRGVGVLVQTPSLTVRGVMVAAAPGSFHLKTCIDS